MADQRPDLIIPNGVAWSCPPTSYGVNKTPDGRGVLVVLRQPNAIVASAWSRTDLTRLIDVLTKHRDELPPDGLALVRELPAQLRKEQGT